MRPIDAEVMMQKLLRMCDYCQDNGLENEMFALYQAGDAVMDCPTLDYKYLVPQGEWIRDNSTMVHCSVCKVARNAFWETYGNLWNFCPNCGARMGGAD